MKKMTNRDTYRTDVLNDFSFICDYQKIFDGVRNKDLYGNQGAAEKKFENCLTKVDSSFIDENADHLGALQSWGYEMRTLATKYKENNNQNKNKNKKKSTNTSKIGLTLEEADQKCDININENVIFLKIDAGINMYHHFCDWINLWISQHINNDFAFSKNVRYVIWQTSGNYWSYYSKTIDAFTDKNYYHLTEFAGKTVCFNKKVMFPLLSRQRYGFYYNMPVPKGCQNSGIFKSFSEHVKFRLAIDNNQLSHKKDLEKECQVTFLSRGDQNRLNPVYGRLILNDQQALSYIAPYFPKCNFKKVVFNKNIKFLDQVKIMSKTDLFISIHGAGMTHLIFLPDHAKVIEIYNCQDYDCYKDLSRLRGLNYTTWSDLFLETKPLTMDFSKDGPKINLRSKNFVNKDLIPGEEFEKVRKGYEKSYRQINSHFIPFGITPKDQKGHHKHSENQKFWNFEVDPEMFLRLVREQISEYYEAPVEKKDEI